MLQKILEKPLEKKAGRNYGPPGNKTLVYFLDDMNMPEVNLYYNSIFFKVIIYFVFTFDSFLRVILILLSRNSNFFKVYNKK